VHSKTDSFKLARPGFSEFLLPRSDELPFENPSFFKKLFAKISVPQIVEIFTHLMFEENVLVVAEDVTDLLPVMFAIKSLLFPLKVNTVVPHLHDDGEEGENGSLSLVSTMIPTF
jgi:hypothetical protein